MVRFQTKNPNLGKIWRALQCKMLVYFMDTWSAYGLLLYFMDICYSSWLFSIFFSRFGILYQEKSGNPVSKNDSKDGIAASEVANARLSLVSLSG
jgi:hypothetical protein